MSDSVKASNVDTVLALSIFSIAVVAGAGNVIYVVRQDLFVPRVSRSLTVVASQFIMLGSYCSSLYNGLSYCRGDMAGFNRGYPFSSLMVMLGSFMLAHVVLGFLPAVQIRLMYNARWNTVAVALTRMLFGVCFCGFIATTLVIGIHDLQHDAPLTNSPLLDVRGLTFTVWLAYGPVLACTVPVLVLKMIIGVKQRLTGLSDMMMDEHGVKPAEVLGDVQKKSIASLCVACPVTVAMAVSTAWPYSPVLDAFATLCSMEPGTSVANNNTSSINSNNTNNNNNNNNNNNSTSPSRPRRQGLAAVKFSNERKYSRAATTPSASKEHHRSLPRCSKNNRDSTTTTSPTSSSSEAPTGRRSPSAMSREDLEQLPYHDDNTHDGNDNEDEESVTVGGGRKIYRTVPGK
ncbi:hypothetical protein HDU86_006619 [Geranomyces michiganensis]|nr:hypothetical protein HDU86_006619 [Geranomyces michiganensis]